MKRKVKIFGRAIPLWVVLTITSVIVVAAGIFAFTQLGQWSATLAPYAGPVVNSDVVVETCTVISDPEGVGSTCDLTVIDGEVDHQVDITSAYDGLQIEVQIPIVNTDTAGGGTVYGQPVIVTEPGIIYRDKPGEPNVPCGKQLDSLEEGWVFYQIEFDTLYDGSAFDVPLVWDFAVPTCP